MRKWSCTIIAFFCVALGHNIVHAALIDFGYHEVIFYGTTSQFEGTTELPIVNSTLTYTPSIGDPFSIHFGASLLAFPYDEDKFYYTWNTDQQFDIFQILAGNEYAIDVPSASDWNGYNSRFRDTFYCAYIFSTAERLEDGEYGIGNFEYDWDDQRGLFMMLGALDQNGEGGFAWYAELTSAKIIAEPSSNPVPEPATLVLTGLGLIGCFLRRKFSKNS